jgi:hypothetical protein
MWDVTKEYNFVIPAKAGIQRLFPSNTQALGPAFTGATI